MNPRSRGAVGVIALALALSACSRINPRYCDTATPCDQGVCNQATNRCEAAGECMVPTDCPLTSPVCDGQACAACTEDEGGNLTCAMRGDGHPVCVGGGCAECRDTTDCAAATPHCDATTHTCGACQLDAECASQVCDEAGGVCVAASAIIYVDGATGADGAACGMAASPCATISAAIDQIGATRRTVAVSGGAGPSATTYVEPLTFDGAKLGAKPIELVGVGALRPVVIGLDNSILTAKDVALHLTVERMDLQTATATTKAGVECVDATLALDDVTVTGCTFLGIRAVNCGFALRRSVVQDDDHGGVELLSGTTFALANDIIALDGTAPDSGVGGVDLIDSTGTIEFVTVMDNQNAAAGRAAGLACSGTATIVVANSVVRGNRKAAAVANVADGDCHYAFSDVEGAIPDGLDDGDNRDVDPSFRAGGLYHLAAGSPIIDKGDPTADVADDIDGQTRPVGGGPDLGADEFTP